MNKSKETLLKAVEKGYKIINGVIYNPKGRVLSPISNRHGYLYFKAVGYIVFIHRLVAYQKYGDRIFEDGIEVRHRDNDKINNIDENILIGTHSQNMMDLPEKQRIKQAQYAANLQRKYTDEEEDEIRKYHEGKTYEQTMKKFGISSTGSLYYILNRRVDSGE